MDALVKEKPEYEERLKEMKANKDEHEDLIENLR